MQLLGLLDFLDKSIWDLLIDPAFLTFVLVGGIGVLGLTLLLALYPISRDTDEG